MGAARRHRRPQRSACDIGGRTVAVIATAPYALVALDVAVFGALTYRIPDELRAAVRPGVLVQAPFRSKSKTGLVVGLTDEVEPELVPKLRDLVDVVDREPLLGAAGIDFLRFLSDYYMAPIGEVVRLALPSAVRLEGVKQYRRVPGAQTQDVPARLRLVFETIPVDVPTTVDMLRAAFGLTFLELTELEQIGAVEVHYEEQATIRAKEDKFYAPIPGVEPKRLGAKQEEILRFLEEAGEPVSLSDIRETFDAPHSSLNALESRGIVAVETREVYRDPFGEAEVVPASDAALTDDQEAALAALREARESGKFRAFLLHGVTGSGKTRVYVEAIRETIAGGRRALVLLPEIALTPQFVAVFRGYFGDAIAVLHSGLSPAEKFDEWRRIRRDEVDIVIGARSALFAPLTEIGLIVVDEEHDPSFKQEESVRYNARDMAVVRAKLEGAQVVLGSATPSLETYENARAGRFVYLPMPKRIYDRPMPEVEIVDVRKKAGDTRERRSDTLSEELLDAMDVTLRAEQQVILFLNRRGFSPCVICEFCGHVWRCPNCDVSLTYHRRQEALRCHHCDHSLRLPETCPECSNHGVGPRGVGTEQLEGHLRGLLPNQRIARLDRDTSRGKRLQALIRRFAKREVDVLVGTQMVTKGHDFPGVTTVGVVNADIGLNFPDLRGAERTFQLLTQVAGRAGRGSDPGRVVVQTYEPEHFALQAASHHDYERFASEELMRRDLFDYPPFGYLIAIKFEAAREADVASTAREYVVAVRRRLRQEGNDWSGVSVKGPAPSPFERLRGKTRWQMLLQSRDRTALRRLVMNVLHDVSHFEPERRAQKTHVVVDVDPINML